VIDGEMVSEKLLNSLSTLVERLREVGEIKIAQVISEVKISEEDYSHLLSSGFTEKVFPGNLKLNLLLETYDLVLTDKSIDIVVLGTHRTSLIPLFTEIRKQATIYAIVADDSLSKSFEECFDGIINLDKIDEFNFQASDFSEFEALTGTNGSLLDYSTITENEVDDANIGITSEDLNEQVDLEKELKDVEINGIIEVDEISEVEIIEPEDVEIEAQLVEKTKVKSKRKKKTLLEKEKELVEEDKDIKLTSKKKPTKAKKTKKSTSKKKTKKKIDNKNDEEKSENKDVQVTDEDQKSSRKTKRKAVSKKK
jgi:hypothetical protein